MTTKTLRCGLQLDHAYALGLSTGKCPCGLIVDADDEGVTLSLFSYVTGEFGFEEHWIRYQLIDEWVEAQLMAKPEPGQPWGDGFFYSDRTEKVFAMDPLDRFQTNWKATHANH